MGTPRSILDHLPALNGYTYLTVCCRVLKTLSCKHGVAESKFPPSLKKQTSRAGVVDASENSFCHAATQWGQAARIDLSELGRARANERFSWECHQLNSLAIAGECRPWPVAEGPYRSLKDEVRHQSCRAQVISRCRSCPARRSLLWLVGLFFHIPADRQDVGCPNPFQRTSTLYCEHTRVI